MNCQRCDSARLLDVRAKCDDRAWLEVGAQPHDGYVPPDLGIGGGDYIDFTVCLDCGQMQGTYPLPPAVIEATED